MNDQTSARQPSSQMSRATSDGRPRLPRGPRAKLGAGLAVGVMLLAVLTGRSEAALQANGMKIHNGLKAHNGMKIHNGISGHNGMKIHNGMSGHNGMKVHNGMSGHNGMKVHNGLSGNGLAPSPIWRATGIDPRTPLSISARTAAR